ALREASLEVFDRTFAITSVLRVLATVVAVIGILSALMALQLERTRELGVLRAQGFTPGEVWRLVMAETGLLGVIAGGLAGPGGVGVGVGLDWVNHPRRLRVVHRDDDPRGCPAAGRRAGRPGGARGGRLSRLAYGADGARPRVARGVTVLSRADPGVTLLAG